MGDNKNRNYFVHQLTPSDSLSEAPSYSTEDKYYPSSKSFHFQDEDRHIPPSELPRSRTRDIQTYEMETLPHRILIDKHLNDERSKRAKSFVTTLVLSLVLGICLIGFAVFLILYETKTCPSSPAVDQRPLTVTVTREGSETTTVTETLSLTASLSSVLHVSKETEDVSDHTASVATTTVTSVSTHLETATESSSAGSSGLITCQRGVSLSGQELAWLDGHPSLSNIAIVLRNGDRSKNLASTLEEFKEIARNSIFECEEDGSLIFKGYCEDGTSGSIPNTRCLMAASDHIIAQVEI